VTQEYTDDRHPYNPGVPPTSTCVRGLDRVVPGGNLFCWQPEEAAVHQLGDKDVTMVMETPVAEPPFPAGRVYGSSADAPAEDGPGELSGSWAFTPARLRDFPEDPEVSTGEAPVNAEETPEAAAARLLREGEEVSWGPWPVRQFSWGGQEFTFDEPGMRLVAALTECGEPFLAEVWWRDSLHRLFRVQWGALLGAGPEELCSMVETWPTAG